MKLLTDYAEEGSIASLKAFDDIYSYINMIPALFWRIDVIKNRIEYINKYALPGLGENSTMILKNLEFSHKIILEEDRHYFDTFHRCITERKPSLVVFRIKLFDGTIRWLKMVGNKDISRSNHYVGYIMDITDTAQFIRSIDNRGAGIANKINLFDNPIFLIHFHDKRIYAGNTFSCKVFGYCEDRVGTLMLDDLIGDNMSQYMDNIYEEIIFSGQWKGRLRLKKEDGAQFDAEVTVRPLHIEGKNLLWFSVYNLPLIAGKYKNTELTEAVQSIDLKKMQKEVETAVKKGSIILLLSAILEHQPLGNMVNSILYSDIHIDQGRVNVYGAGEPFNELPPAQAYPYEGTIAENIVNYGLDHIIVDNTLESIKPIDWVLFIPHGIKSYYAKPFYEHNVLRTVLIFCSSQPSTFNESNAGALQPLYPYFLNGLYSWRKKTVTKY